MAGLTADGGQPRPYSGPDATGGSAGRGDAFSTGITGDPSSAATSLNQDSVRWNSPGRFRPTSVLQPVGTNPGGNGMSEGDAARRWADGSYQGSVNGTAQSSFEPAAMLRLTGQSAQ